MKEDIESAQPMRKTREGSTGQVGIKPPSSSGIAYAPRVNVLKKVKLGTSWRFAPLKQDSNNRISWNSVLIDGKEEIHKEGTFYIEWYDNGRRKRESVGKFPHEVLERARRKRLVLESERAGIQVKEPEASDPHRLHSAIDRYLEFVKLFKKPSTYKHYRNALGRFKERCSRIFVHQVDRDDLVDFMSYLSGLGLDNRTIYTKTMVVVQMLKDAGVPKILRKGDWPRYTAEERSIYTPGDLRVFFRKASAQERILFQFFLLTGFRESEVKHVSWEDIDFREQVVRVKAKPKWKFIPKNWEEREVPIPSTLLNSLAALKLKTTVGTDLIFPSPGGKPEYHMLEKCKAVASRAGLNCGHCQTKKGSCKEGPYCGKFFLHKFRHTFATTHLRDGIDLRTVQHWMGHKDLKSTMVYLKPARGKEIIRKVNAGSLSAIFKSR